MYEKTNANTNANTNTLEAQLGVARDIVQLNLTLAHSESCFREGGSFFGAKMHAFRDTCNIHVIIFIGGSAQNVEMYNLKTNEPVQIQILKIQECVFLHFYYQLSSVQSPSFIEESPGTFRVKK